MTQMKELYEKVATDADLQKKFGEILSEGEKAGKEATEEKLVAFAKDAGYVLTIAEMQEFFKQLEKKEEGELSDLELDMVAGGKSNSGTAAVWMSVLTVGIGCAMLSIAAEVPGSGVWGNCADQFQ